MEPLADNGPMIAATAIPTDPPSAPDQGREYVSYNAVRAIYVYAAATAANVRWWVWSPSAAAWVIAFETDDDAALAPTGITGESRDYAFGVPSRIFPEVVSVAGGTIAVYADGVSVGG